MSQAMGSGIEVPAGAALARYIESLWGTKTRLVPQAQVAVLTTPVRVVKNNPRRMGLIVINLGTGTVFLDWNASVVSGSGIPLVGVGSSLILTAFEDGELVGYELVSISAATGNTLAVWEIEGI